MMSSVMLLTHVGENEAAHKLQSSIETVYREGKHLTGDVGGSASTEEFTEAVIKTIKEG
jgi:isocitrate dehydrogenase (NAD+)